MGRSATGVRLRIGAILTLAVSGIFASTVPALPAAAAGDDPVAAAASPAASAAAAPAALPADTIPLGIHETADGGFLPTVQISIDGGAPLTMMLDSGTAQLVTFPWAKDRIPDVDDTGVPATQFYDGTTTKGTVALGSVTIGGQATTEPIAFVLGDECVSANHGHHCLGETTEIDGVLGIAQGSWVAGPYQLYSAVNQLAPEVSAGLTVRLTSTGGTLTLGRPDLTAPGTAVLQRAPLATGYANGTPAFEKEAPLCVVIHNARRCAPTTVDTGEHGAMIMGREFEPFAVHPLSPHRSGETSLWTLGPLATGTVVGFAEKAVDGGSAFAPFARWTVAAPATAEYACVSAPAAAGNCDGEPYFNTGNAFFLGRAIAFDSVTGQIGIGSSESAPSVPRQLEATAEDGALHATWTEPASPGDAPVRSYVVTATRDADGLQTVERLLPADARSVRLPATDGDAYTVTVAAENEYGVGPAASAASLTPRADGSAELAATGSAPAGLALSALACAVAGLAALLLASARRRRTTG